MKFQRYSQKLQTRIKFVVTLDYSVLCYTFNYLLILHDRIRKGYYYSGLLTIFVSLCFSHI